MELLFWYSSPVPDYLKATVDTITRIHHQEKEGDILAFLTGQVSIFILPGNIISSTGKAQNKHISCILSKYLPCCSKMKTYLKYITPSDYANPTRSTCSQIFLQQYFTVIQLLVLIFGYQKLTVSVPFPFSLFGFLEWQQVILKIRELILCLNWCYIFLNERLYLSKSLSGTFQFILQKTVMNWNVKLVIFWWGVAQQQ